MQRLAVLSVDGWALSVEDVSALRVIESLAELDGGVGERSSTGDRVLRAICNPQTGLLRLRHLNVHGLRKTAERYRLLHQLPKLEMAQPRHPNFDSDFLFFPPLDELRDSEMRALSIVVFGGHTSELVRRVELCKRVEELQLHHTLNIEQATVVLIGLTQLHKLDVSRVALSSFSVLAASSQLEQLRLAHPHNGSPFDLQQLQNAAPFLHCCELELKARVKLSEAQASQLFHLFPSLTSLKLEQFTLSSLACLLQCVHLRTLLLTRCRGFQSRTFLQLHPLSQLRSIALVYPDNERSEQEQTQPEHYAPVPNEQLVEEMRARMPQCDIREWATSK